MSFLEWLFRYQRLPKIQLETLTSHILCLHQALEIETLEGDIKRLHGIEPVIIQAVAVLIDKLTERGEMDSQGFQHLVESVEILQNLPGEGHPLWKSLNQLRDRPYHKRVWTFQERALA